MEISNRRFSRRSGVGSVAFVVNSTSFVQFVLVQ